MATTPAMNSSCDPPKIPQSSSTSGPMFDGVLLQLVTQWSIPQYALTLFLALAVYDQVLYLHKKGSIAGPRFKIPLMGPFIQSLYPKFEGYLAQWASGPLSCVSIFHKFVVLASDRDLAHKIFKSPTYTEPCIVPVAKDVLGHKNWVFLHGKEHVDYRKGLKPLFTNEAMSSYLPVHAKVLDTFFGKLVAASEANNGRPRAFMNMFRELNCALACRTFFGDYISQEAVQNITNNFYQITASMELVSIPWAIHIPFSKQWKGKRTADAVRAAFTHAAAACKVNMARGAKPQCVADHWVLHMLESKRYYERLAAEETDVEKPTNLIREFTNLEIGETLLSFLFASQDASSSATTWLFQILGQRPDMLARLRDENLAARGGDASKCFELAMLDRMPFTQAFIKEVLRHRPPVIFVPYLATKDFPITPDFTVPKNTIVVPSCWPALHDPEVYPNPEVFDPERWISGDAEEHTKNWLVFGSGPHDCLARRYVPLYLAGIIGKAALELDWKHYATDKSEEIRVFASLFPMDECQLVFQNID